MHSLKRFLLQRLPLWYKEFPTQSGTPTAKWLRLNPPALPKMKRHKGMLSVRDYVDPPPLKNDQWDVPFVETGGTFLILVCYGRLDPAANLSLQSPTIIIIISLISIIIIITPLIIITLIFVITPVIIITLISSITLKSIIMILQKRYPFFSGTCSQL